MKKFKRKTYEDFTVLQYGYGDFETKEIVDAFFKDTNQGFHLMSNMLEEGQSGRVFLLNVDKSLSEVREGDYLIKDFLGKIILCSPEDFVLNYEEINGPRT